MGLSSWLSTTLNFFNAGAQRPRLEVLLYPLPDPNGFIWPCVKLIAHNGTFGIQRIDVVIRDDAGKETRLDLRIQEYIFPKGGVVTPAEPWNSTLHHVRSEIKKGRRFRIEVQRSDGNWKYSKELESSSVYV